jgi:NAD(P)-dependent dehydrogenase (short-subunit alcohol dehydrogenase family)
MFLIGRDSEKLQNLAQGYGSGSCVADAADWDQIDRALGQAHEVMQGLNAVVCLAGSVLLKPMHLTSRAEWDATMQANLSAAAGTLRSAVTRMNDGGSIVLMSSAAAHIGLSNHEAIAAAKAALELKCPHRVILGTDGPAGSGVQPLGMLRMVALLSSLANIPAELVFCFATGNTARIRNLNCGLIEVGRAADFVFMARAQHTAGRTLLESVQLGDIPGIGMVMIDGLVRCHRSRNTPPATEVPVVVH